MRVRPCSSRRMKPTLAASSCLAAALALTPSLALAEGEHAPPAPAAPPALAAPVPAAIAGPPEVARAPAAADLPYREGLPVPPGYRVRTERATGLLIAGGVTFFAGYGAAYAAAIVINGRLHLDGRSADTLGYYPLYIPFAGPFVGLATVDPSGTETAALIACGAVQIAGGAIIVAGLLGDERRLVRIGTVELGLSPDGQGITGRF